MTSQIASFLLAIALCSAISCDGTKHDSTKVISDKNEPRIDADISDDIFWQNCAWLSKSEFDELDSLQKKLIDQANAPKSIQKDFTRYVDILTLKRKTDADILSCVPAANEDREKLFGHFIFLGLSYGHGDFSFVDKPRLASLFEMDHFYNYESRKFNAWHIGITDHFTNVNFRLARYLLGGLIAMNASVKQKAKSSSSITDIAASIGEELKIVKYGRTSIFTKELFDIRADLNRYVEIFLAANESFANAYVAAAETTVKTYPAFLKEDYPFWSIDYSEINSQILSDFSKNVVGVSPSPGGQPLLTGSFMKHDARILLITAGHWVFNKTVAVLIQKDPAKKNIGKEEAKLEWLHKQFPIFNFSEQLVVPTLKAIGFTNSEITEYLPRIERGGIHRGDFEKFRSILPWIDMAIALPDNDVIHKAGIDLNDIPLVKKLDENNKSVMQLFSFGFGVTENLAADNLAATKSPGLRRLTSAIAAFQTFREIFLQKDVRILHAFIPRTLDQIKDLHGNTPAFPTFAMLYNIRCSGSPFYYVDDQRLHVAGILVSGLGQEGTKTGQMELLEFRENNFGLINELVAHPQALNNIPESDLVQMLRRHMFADEGYRKEVNAAIKKAYAS